MSEETRPPEKAEPAEGDDEARESGNAAEEERSLQDLPSPEESPAQDASPAAETVVEVRSGGRGIAVFALLVALVAAAGAGYLWWTQEQFRAGDAASRADFQGDLGRLERSIANLDDGRTEISRLEDQVRQRQQDMQRAQDDLSQRVSIIGDATRRLAERNDPGGATDWQRQEVEQLLRIANYQLALADDPDSAIAALEAADDQLRALDDPTMVPVRQAIADEILALRSIETPDVEGVALQLGSLATRVDTLRLAGMVDVQAEDTRSATPADSGLARIRRKISEFFASIFRVRKTTGSTAPLLAPNEAFFLKRNLELELRAARLSLLSRDDVIYRESLRSARRWTEEYFDADDRNVRNFIETIADLEGRSLTVTWPDISGSLRVLRQAAASGGRETPAQ